MSNLLAFVLGMQLPLGDSNWTDTVDVSPKLGARAGVQQGELTGMLSADYTFERLTSQLTNPMGFDTGASGYRVRVLAHLGVDHPINDKVRVTARAGGGIDLAHGSYDYTLLGTHFSSSDSDVGWAFEFGAGLWWDTGGAEVGGEVALPIGHHDDKAQNGHVGFQYTSTDLDILVGVRFRQ